MMTPKEAWGRYTFAKAQAESALFAALAEGGDFADVVDAFEMVALWRIGTSTNTNIVQAIWEQMLHATDGWQDFLRARDQGRQENDG